MLKVGLGLGAAVLLCLVVIFTLSVFIFWKFALKKKGTASELKVLMLTVLS